MEDAIVKNMSLTMLRVVRFVPARLFKIFNNGFLMPLRSHLILKKDVYLGFD